MSPRRPTDPLGLLRHYRPTRYEHEDRQWMTAAVDAREKEILDSPDDVDQLVRRLARDEAWREVRKMEERDVRVTHLFLRTVGKTGQWPLSMDFEHDVSVSPIKIGRLVKVRFQVCQPNDFASWELERRRTHDQATQVMMWEARGAQIVAEWMRDQSVDLAGNLDKGAVPGYSDPVDDDDDD